jgi:hypothetical protein
LGYDGRGCITTIMGLVCKMSYCTACGNECYEDRIVLDGFDYCCAGCAKEHKKIIQDELDYWQETVFEGKTYVKRYKRILKRLSK